MRVSEAKRLEALNLNCNRPETPPRIGYRMVEPRPREVEASYVFDEGKQRPSLNTLLRKLIYREGR